MSLVFYSLFCLVVCIVAVGVRVCLSQTQERIIATWVIVISLMLLLALNILNAFVVVPNGHVGVQMLFGKRVDGAPLDAGIHVTNPYYSIQHMNIQRREVKRTSVNGSGSEGGIVVVQSSDELSLEVDVTLPYILNPKYADRVYAGIGDDKLYHQTLMISAASHAVRDAYVAFSASEAYGAKRQELAEKITEIFHQRIIGQLRPLPVFAELSEEELNTVFISVPVQLEKTVPPERVRSAIAENKAALLELERQQTLNQIATQEASRRGQEGIGVSKFLTGLPEGTSIDRAIELITASANMERARAFKIGVEQGNLKMVYITDGGRVPIAATGGPIQ